MLIREFVDIPRDQMPQINAEHLGNHDTVRGQLALDKIKPSQSERVPGKTEKTLAAIKRGEVNGENKPLIVDRYGYLVNGHHRYDAYRQLGHKRAEVIIVKDATVHELMDEFANTTSDEPANESKQLVESRKADEISIDEKIGIIDECSYLIRQERSTFSAAADIWHDAIKKDVSRDNKLFLTFLENTLFPIWEAAGFPKYPSEEYDKKVRQVWLEKFIYNKNLKTKDRWWEQYMTRT